jgi:hypothetical protein
MLVRAIEGYSTLTGMRDVECTPYWLLTTVYFIFTNI